MLQEVKFGIPRISVHLEWSGSGKGEYLTHRILPGVPQIGDTVLITREAGPLVGEVIKHIWHFNDEFEDGNDYVVVKIRELKKESEAALGESDDQLG